MTDMTGRGVAGGCTRHKPGGRLNEDGTTLLCQLCDRQFYRLIEVVIKHPTGWVPRVWGSGMGGMDGVGTKGAKKNKNV